MGERRIIRLDELNRLVRLHYYFSLGAPDGNGLQLEKLRLNFLSCFHASGLSSICKLRPCLP